MAPWKEGEACGCLPDPCGSLPGQHTWLLGALGLLLVQNQRETEGPTGSAFGSPQGHQAPTLDQEARATAGELGVEGSGLQGPVFLAPFSVSVIWAS